MTRFSHFLVAFCSLAAAACSAPPSAGTPVIALDTPSLVAAENVADGSAITVTANGLGPSDELSLKVTDIHLLVKSGAKPELEQLVLPLGDADVPASVVGPKGLKLRNLQLSVTEPVAATVVHQQADALELTANAPLQLDWSLLLADGTLYKLGPARTKPLDLDVAIVRTADGATTATVTASCPGDCWSIEGIADLRDGQLYVESGATVSADR